MATTESYEDRKKRERKEMDEKLAKATDAFWEKLHAKLRERGHDFEVDPEKGHRIRKIDGIINLGVSIKAERKGGGYYGSTKESGKLRCTVGDYGDKKQFFQSQARGGDFDYDLIADEIRDRIARVKAANAKRREDRRIENEAWALRDALIREFVANFVEKKGFDDDDNEVVYAHLPEGTPVRLKPSSKGLSIEFDRPLTEAELREVLAGCKKAGLI